MTQVKSLPQLDIEELQELNEAYRHFCAILNRHRLHYTCRVNDDHILGVSDGIYNMPLDYYNLVSFMEV